MNTYEQKNSTDLDEIEIHNPFHRVVTNKTADPFRRLSSDEINERKKCCTHILRNGYRCATDTIGYQTPRGLSPAELVLDASEGFIPLWERDTILRWRFNGNSFLQFEDPSAAMEATRNLMSKALLLWGSASPVRFSEHSDLWDFEVIVREADNCDVTGCVLASAFLPDQGRHELVIYPKAFEQPNNELLETLAHEFGHIFGLRHFFAQLHESAWASETFGEHIPFSIMNYGNKSMMTEQDQKDLKLLYSQVWSGNLTHINDTPIRLVRPYHSI